MKIIIDLEFRDLLPESSADELDRLAISLKVRGCEEPLVLWGNILVDGHQRYAICQRFDLEYETVSREFSDRTDAMRWMLDNQISRRNLSPDKRKEAIGKRLNLEKKAIGRPVEAENKFPQVEGIKRPKGSGTAEMISKQTGLSRATVERAGAKEDAVEKVKAVAPELAVKVRSAPQAIAVAAGKAADQGVDAVRAALNGRDKPKTAPEVDVVGIPMPPHVQEAFVVSDSFGSLMARITSLKGEWEEISKGPAGYYLDPGRLKSMDNAVDLMRSSIKHCRPYAVCPACKGKKCKGCNNSGYATDTNFVALGGNKYAKGAARF